MMNGSDNNVNLALTLGYANSTIKTRLKNGPGAGAGAIAGLNVDITFAASDPLSELVWSPQKGLSLRCADCSKDDEKPFLLWNVGPSNTIPPPPQSIKHKEIGSDKIVDGNLILSNGTVHFQSEPALKASSPQFPRNSLRHMIGSSSGLNLDNSDKMTEKNRGERAPLGNDEDKGVSSQQTEHMADMADGSQKRTVHLSSSLEWAISKPVSGKLHKEMLSNYTDTTKAVGFDGQLLAGVTKLPTEIMSGDCISSLPMPPCQDLLMKEVMLGNKEERKSKIKTNDSKLPTLEKLESTADNDLRHLIPKEAYGQSEQRLLRGSSVPHEIAPTNGNQRKGKSKAASDGNFSGRFSNDEDDSNESVESCNSACLLSRGKKRLRYVESIIIDDKRIKNHIDGRHSSTSIVRNDRSFMNWMSNLVKGFPKPNQEDAPLTLGHSNDRCASIFQETILSHEQNDSAGRNLGFQTIFPSLYSSNIKLSDARVAEDDCLVEKAQELVQADKTNVGNFQISWTEQTNFSLGNNFLSTDKRTPSIKDAVSQSGKCMLPASIPVQEYYQTDQRGKRSSSDQKCCEDRGGINSFGSADKQKTANVDTGGSLLASDGRSMCDVSSSKFGSLWISRLSPKAGITSLSLVHRNKASSEDFGCPAVCPTLDPKSRTCLDLSINQKRLDVKDNSGEIADSLSGKELQIFGSKTEQPSVTVKEILKHNHQYVEINPSLPSEKIKSSEAVASIFAWRLDVLKHSMPSSSKKVATCTAGTCLFCGKDGHGLQNCSEVSETEMECLLSNISSYEGAENWKGLCIRCFQRDHWAVSCPAESSSRQQNLETGNLKLYATNEINFCFLEKDDHPKGSVSCKGRICSATDLRNPTTNAKLFCQQSSTSPETKKHLISNCKGNILTEYQNLPTVVNSQMNEIPKGIFDAVRRLQVSRADILKLINSQVLVSHLEGFFMRLRLGKGEAGCIESGYYVACITEQPRISVKSSMKSISVNVGGINSLVGSQYVSNDDFLEDEFMAWWCRTLKSGGKLPSQDYLESKFEQRIKFRF